MKCTHGSPGNWSRIPWNLRSTLWEPLLTTIIFPNLTTEVLWLSIIILYQYHYRTKRRRKKYINPLNAESNPICHLLALLRSHHILHVSGVRVKINLKETGLEGVKWSELIQDRDQWHIPTNTVSVKSKEYCNRWVTVSLSMTLLRRACYAQISVINNYWHRHIQGV
jgi:hypothetical protein